MKPRKVVVTIELDTNIPIAILRNKDTWDWISIGSKDVAEIIQVQANVIKEEEGRKAGKSKCCNM